MSFKLLKKFIFESLGAQADETFLQSNGWYPLDKRLFVWAHPIHTDGKGISRREALNIERPERPDDLYPGIG